MKTIDRVRAGDAVYVFLDPDGSLPGSSLYVVVEKATGIVYGTQCAGVGTKERMAEGFLVPVGGKNADGSSVTEGELRAVFHNEVGCLSDLLGRAIRADRLDRLRRLVSQIPLWVTTLDVPHTRVTLLFDEDRVDETAEAWVPVTTPLGPGVLLWDNCD